MSKDYGNCTVLKVDSIHVIDKYYVLNIVNTFPDFIDSTAQFALRCNKLNSFLMIIIRAEASINDTIDSPIGEFNKEIIEAINGLKAE